MTPPALRLPRVWLPSVLCAALLSACAVGPDYTRPDLTKGAGYTRQPLPTTASADGRTGGAAQHFANGQDVPGQWWQLFHSPELNTLVQEALKANPSAAAAQASLRQANELVYASQASFFPSISGSVSETRERQGFFTFPAQVFTVASASLSVSYAPDIFGGTRRQVESAKAQAQYQRFQLEATYLTLTTNVVNTAVTLASIRDQIAATESLIQLQAKELDILQERQHLGAVSSADVLAQQATLAQTRAGLPPLHKQLAQARNQLAAYLGRFPNQTPIENFTLSSLHLPETLPLSLPSAIVEQRPDVRAAEAQLHQTSAEIGVAIANQLPQFSITGSLGSSASSLSKLFTSGTGLWSIVGSVAQTIFDAGALEHKKRAAVAAFDASADQYRGTVIGAFQDVSNSLRALESDADALQQQSDAERAAQDSLNLAQGQYKLGAVSYPSLLSAQQTYQNAVLARVKAQAARYSDTAALFQALGGGWWNRSDVAAASRGQPLSIGLPLVSSMIPSSDHTEQPNQ
ncbi:efflux transporter outer membrane subunit [Bordetella sp. FB-8]|uniref:efflux transporter outer membrane subunit n=1 Tax=Bordetella sp. FB-8 TaxID=1159870 RepID=UPI0006846355|nr:efflux transporter outer membrane subunit [Bordetella sp. FB-8]